jgi:hypothetical protein
MCGKKLIEHQDNNYYTNCKYVLKSLFKSRFGLQTPGCEKQRWSLKQKH